MESDRAGCWRGEGLQTTNSKNEVGSKGYAKNGVRFERFENENVDLE